MQFLKTKLVNFDKLWNTPNLYSTIFNIQRELHGWQLSKTPQAWKTQGHRQLEYMALPTIQNHQKILIKWNTFSSLTLNIHFFYNHSLPSFLFSFFRCWHLLRFAWFWLYTLGYIDRWTVGGLMCWFFFGWSLLFTGWGCLWFAGGALCWLRFQLL